MTSKFARFALFARAVRDLEANSKTNVEQEFSPNEASKAESTPVIENAETSKQQSECLKMEITPTTTAELESSKQTRSRDRLSGTASMRNEDSNADTTSTLEQSSSAQTRSRARKSFVSGENGMPSKSRSEGSNVEMVPVVGHSKSLPSAENGESDNWNNSPSKRYDRNNRPSKKMHAENVRHQRHSGHSEKNEADVAAANVVSPDVLLKPEGSDSKSEQSPCKRPKKKKKGRKNESKDDDVTMDCPNQATSGTLHDEWSTAAPNDVSVDNRSSFDKKDTRRSREKAQQEHAPKTRSHEQAQSEHVSDIKPLFEFGETIAERIKNRHSGGNAAMQTQTTTRQQNSYERQANFERSNRPSFNHGKFEPNTSSSATNNRNTKNNNVTGSYRSNRKSAPVGWEESSDWQNSSTKTEQKSDAAPAATIVEETSQNQSSSATQKNDNVTADTWDQNAYAGKGRGYLARRKLEKHVGRISVDNRPISKTSGVGDDASVAEPASELDAAKSPKCNVECPVLEADKTGPEIDRNPDSSSKRSERHHRPSAIAIETIHPLIPPLLSNEWAPSMRATSAIVNVVDNKPKSVPMEPTLMSSPSCVSQNQKQELERKASFAGPVAKAFGDSPALPAGVNASKNSFTNSPSVSSVGSLNDSASFMANEQWEPSPYSNVEQIQPQLRRVSSFNSPSVQERFASNYFHLQSTYVDSHCHLDLILWERHRWNSTFEKFRTEKVATSFPPNFGGCITVFCHPRNYDRPGGLEKVIGLVQEDNVFGVIGCHPKCAAQGAWTERLEANIRQIVDIGNRRVLAIGECGLDYSQTVFANEAEKQKSAFVAQMKMAVDLQLPLVIHSRDAEEDCFQVMKDTLPHDHPVHRHCFTGSVEEMKKWHESFPNMSFGFTPIAMVAKSPLFETIKEVPLDKLLLETDAPYFFPSQARGLPGLNNCSHPGFAICIGKHIAWARSMDAEQLLQATYNNTVRLYKADFKKFANEASFDY